MDGDSSKGRNRNLALAAVALLVFVLAAGLAVYTTSGNSSSGSAAPATTSAAQSSNSSAVLFSSTSAYSYSYLVSASSLSTAARQAVSGFSINRTVFANGSIRMAIDSLQQGGPNETIVIKPGESLYYVEGSFSDDSPPSGEYAYSDDGFVLTNSSGYVITQP